MRQKTFILKNHRKEQKEIEIKASFETTDNTIKASFEITGDISNYIFNHPSRQTRKNELWKETCFELFLAHKNSSEYYEANISPSTEWNFYNFSDYKTDMKEKKDIYAPLISSVKMVDKYSISFEFEFNAIRSNLSFNLCVILLDKEGIRDFYSIHRKKENVDFHDREYWSLLN